MARCLLAASGTALAGGADTAAATTSNEAATSNASAVNSASTIGTVSSTVNSATADESQRDATFDVAAGLIPFAIGTRVEVYWTKDQAWYPGNCTDARMGSHSIKGRKQQTVEIRVDYDDQVPGHRRPLQTMQA